MVQYGVLRNHLPNFVVAICCTFLTLSNNNKKKRRKEEKCPCTLKENKKRGKGVWFIHRAGNINENVFLIGLINDNDGSLRQDNHVNCLLLLSSSIHSLFAYLR